jgi:hypothetical protein
MKLRGPRDVAGILHCNPCMHYVLLKRDLILGKQKLQLRLYYIDALHNFLS